MFLSSQDWDLDNGFYRMRNMSCFLPSGVNLCLAVNRETTKTEILTIKSADKSFKIKNELLKDDFLS